MIRASAVSVPGRFIRLAANTVLLAMGLPFAVASAQSQLPAPSRTIYKCHVKGTVSYSDEPCEGAQRLDATPSSGVNHLSGSTRIGNDVAREIHTEQMADAFRPISGMNAAEFAAYGRRSRLAASAQRECRQLEPAILKLEEAETHAGAGEIKGVQGELFGLRKRYKTLGC